MDREWFDFMIETGLFKCDNSFFWSESLKRRMKAWDSKRNSYARRGAAGGRAKAERMSSSATAQAQQSSGCALPITEHNITEEKRREESHITRTRARDGEIEYRKRVDNEFDLFWAAYPKKVGKKAALKALQKARKSGCPEIEVLVGAIDKHRKSAQWRRDGGQYIPNPATWLNEGRWDDIPLDGPARKLLPQEQAQLAIQEWLAEEEEKVRNGQSSDSGSVTDDFGVISGSVAANKTNNASVVKDAQGHRPEIRTRGGD